MTTILWSQTAKNDYWQNIDFLLNRWSEIEATHFINEVENTIEILRQGNVSFKATGYKNTYQVVIAKQITLYYHMNQSNEIELLRFFYNLQNPDKLIL